MKEGTSPEVLKARESRGEPRVGRVRGSGPCRGVIERPGGSRHDKRILVRYAVKATSRYYTLPFEAKSGARGKAWCQPAVCCQRPTLTGIVVYGKAESRLRNKLVKSLGLPGTGAQC